MANASRKIKQFRIKHRGEALDNVATVDFPFPEPGMIRCVTVGNIEIVPAGHPDDKSVIITAVVIGELIDYVAVAKILSAGTTVTDVEVFY